MHNLDREINSSAVSNPTLNLNNPKVIFLASLTSLGTAACDIVAGCESIVSTPPKLTETKGKERASTKSCAFVSSFKRKPNTAPP